MGTFEIIQEITYALTVCNRYSSCQKCPYEIACLSHFGKGYISEEIRELAEQCRAFNESVRFSGKE